MHSGRERLVTFEGLKAFARLGVPYSDLRVETAADHQVAGTVELQRAHLVLTSSGSFTSKE